MKIAVVTDTPHRVGGAETYLDTLLPLMQARGHALALCTRLARQQGVPVLAEGASEARFAIGADRAAFLRNLDRWRPDVIFLHGLEDVDAERACRSMAPTAYVAHTYYGTCISSAKCFQLPAPAPCDRVFGAGCLVRYFPRRCGGLSPRTMVRLYRVQRQRLAMLRTSDAVLTLSRHMRTECERHGVDGRRIVVLPQWPADSDGPVPDAAAGPAGPPWQLLFLARLERVKGGALIIDALPQIAVRLGAPVTLTVAGDGPDRDRLAYRAQQAMRGSGDVSIRFAGRVDAHGRRALLAASHLLVVPSVWPEPFGLVGLEAARYGVPAVAFAVGGIPEWLHDGVTGHLAGARPDVGALAEAVVRSVSDPREYARLRAGAAAHAASLDRGRHVGALDAVFESIVRRPA